MYQLGCFWEQRTEDLSKSGLNNVKIFISYNKIGSRVSPGLIQWLEDIIKEPSFFSFSVLPWSELAFVLEFFPQKYSELSHPPKTWTKSRNKGKFMSCLLALRVRETLPGAFRRLSLWLRGFHACAESDHWQEEKGEERNTMMGLD